MEPPTDSSSKKGPFDGLDREELIKKCKALLNLARNAKQTKDEYAEENSKLKEQLGHYEQQKVADKESLKAMQEVVNSLTEQKLQLTISHSDLERSIATATAERTAAETGLKSELQRMVQENADLVISVKKLELQLEKSMPSNSNETIAEQLEKLQIENQDLLSANAALIASNERLQLKRKTLVDAHNLISSKCQSHETKLRLYKTKLTDFSAQLRELRACKEVLLQTVREYSQAVSKWQSEILTVSNEFFEKNRCLRLENKNLKERILDLDKIAADLVARDTELEEQRLRYEKLLQEYQRLEEEKCKFSAMLDAIKSTEDGDESSLRSLKELANETEQKCATLQTSLAEANERATVDGEKIKALQCKVELQHVELQQLKFQKQMDADHLLEEKENEISNLKSALEERESVLIIERELAAIKLEEHLKESQSNETKYDQEIVTLKSIVEKQTSVEQIKEIEIQQLNGEKERLLEIIATSNTSRDAMESSQKDELTKLLRNLTEKDEFIDNLQSKFVDTENALAATNESYERRFVELSDQKEVQIKQKSTEISELLNEMSEINEALKKRGDIISQQEQRLTELTGRYEALQKRANDLDAMASIRSGDVERLNDRIKELERTQPVVATTIDADQMSTSTVSRAEDVARMRDLDESFEDKYNRLRTVALKLKRKVAEQTKIIADLEAKTAANCTEETLITSKLGAIEVQVRNLHLLQSENDRLQDELNTALAEGKKVAELQERLNVVTVELDALRTDEGHADRRQQNTLDAACKEYVKQIAALKEELNVGKICKRDVDDEVARLRQELKTALTKTKCQQDDEAKIKAELAKVKASVKSTNVLNLEMEAYEKSLNEMSAKMDAKKLQISELEEIKRSDRTTIESLQNQIKLIESSLKAEHEHSIELKQQIDLQMGRLKTSEHEKSELKSKLDELKAAHKSVTGELEELTFSTGQTINDRDRQLHKLQTEIDAQSRLVLSTKEESDNYASRLQSAEQELLDKATEFSAYKLRAQSMLRQTQTKDSSHETELTDQLQSAQASVEALTETVQTLNDQRRQLNAAVDELAAEKQRLQQRVADVMAMLEESRTQLDATQAESRLAAQSHQDSLKGLRLQIETLNECYKTQYAELTAAHESKINELRTAAPVASAAAVLAGTQHQQRYDNDTRRSASDEQKIDWLMTERQEGEGSESNMGSVAAAAAAYGHRKNSRGRRELIPLDELLNNSFEENSNDDVDNLFSSEMSTFEQQQINEQLSIQKSRVKHLTTLLAEAEQDTARLTQLNDVLKEELRRQERSAEREQHLHNLEYLKNVVFKFLTINCGDEKSHLVPVLNTILKLSPEETQKLQTVAKGIQGAQKGWGRYLPI